MHQLHHYLWSENCKVKAILCSNSWSCWKSICSFWVFCCPLCKHWIVKSCSSHSRLRTDMLPPVKKIVQVAGIKCILKNLWYSSNFLMSYSILQPFHHWEVPLVLVERTCVLRQCLLQKVFPWKCRYLVLSIVLVWRSPAAFLHQGQLHRGRLNSQKFPKKVNIKQEWVIAAIKRFLSSYIYNI